MDTTVDTILNRTAILVGIASATLVPMIFYFLNKNQNRDLKKFLVNAEHIDKYTTKMEDRLVLAEEMLCTFSAFSKELQISLRMTSNNLRAFDTTLPKDVSELINIWEGCFSRLGGVQTYILESDEDTSRCIGIINLVRSKIDKLRN